MHGCEANTCTSSIIEYIYHTGMQMHVKTTRRCESAQPSQACFGSGLAWRTPPRLHMPCRGRRGWLSRTSFQRHESLATLPYVLRGSPVTYSDRLVTPCCCLRHHHHHHQPHATCLGLRIYPCCPHLVRSHRHVSSDCDVDHLTPITPVKRWTPVP